MINELIWDSSVLKKKIGELSITPKTSSRIEAALQKAREDKFEYLTCKITSQDTFLIKLLGSYGFYMTDIGITLAIETEAFLMELIPRNPTIHIATKEDIPILKKIATALFSESRFYSDPFFSKEEADKLYRTWTENSVKGTAADIVFWIPRRGFITCKKSWEHSGKMIMSQSFTKDKENPPSPPFSKGGKGGFSGEIVLLGIKKSFRGKGCGTALVKESMRWFHAQDISSVTVRTQLKNLSAINFYLNLGFSLRGYDIVFGNIL
jgi:dTDP-4-amino-4,6-dideoxy-D-galactose acyltransferase